MQPQGRTETVAKPTQRRRPPRSIAKWDRRTLDLDRRSVPFLRYESIRCGIIADLGGEDAVTTAQAQMADRAAFISMKLEMLQIADLSGGEIDLQRYGELVDRGRRSFETIGLERRARDLTPTVDQYVAGLAHENGEDDEAEAVP
jgi:hypothetical protein